MSETHRLSVTCCRPRGRVDFLPFAIRVACWGNFVYCINLHEATFIFNFASPEAHWGLCLLCTFTMTSSQDFCNTPAWYGLCKLNTRAHLRCCAIVIFENVGRGSPVRNSHFTELLSYSTSFHTVIARPRVSC